MNKDEIKIEEVTSDELREDYKLKVVIVGDSGVGKSNLIKRFTTNEFNENSKATVGVEFLSKSYKINDKIFKIEMWDTAGQERYKSITAAYYKGAKGALLVYDTTSAQSFENIDKWLSEIKEKTNKDIKLNDQKAKFKLKVETEHQLDTISKIFNDIHSLEIKRREMMLKKLKQDQSRTNDKFKNALKSFREVLFSNERSNLHDNESIENFLKEILKIEQQLVLAKNEDSYNIIMDDLSLYQLSTKYYQSSNMAKYFIKGITHNYKLLESLQNYKDILEYIDGILNISEKIVENKADILHKYAMKLFKEGNYDEAQKKLEIAVNTTKDKKGKMLLQFDLDKVILTNMHSNVKNFKHGDYEQAIQICDRLLESPYIKDRNKEKIKYMRNLDVKRLEQLKNNKNNIENKYKSSNLIREEVNEIDFELGDE